MAPVASLGTRNAMTERNSPDSSTRRNSPSDSNSSAYRRSAPIETPTHSEHSIAVHDRRAAVGSAQALRKSPEELEKDHRWEEIVQELRQKIGREIHWEDPKTTTTTVKGFALPDTATRLLDEPTLETLYDHLSHPRHGSRARERFVEVINTKGLHRFVATMILSDCRRSAAESFVDRCVFPSRDQTHGATERPLLLPLPLDRLKVILGDDGAAQQFRNWQCIFSGKVLEKGNQNTIRVTEELPYLDEKKLGAGGFGTVYRVRIAKGYLQDPHDQNDRGQNERSYLLARKDLEGEEAKDAMREETGVMRNILRTSFRRHDNILEYFGCVLQGLPSTKEMKLSIFTPLGDHSLYSYMEQKHPDPPKNPEERLSLLHSATGLADGLRFLHGDLITQELAPIACYHLDIKPENVIVFLRGEKEATWKIGDFGLSTIKLKHSHNEPERSAWKLYQKDASSSFSPAHPRRGQGAHQPPETSQSGKVMNRQSDVWSLGCVLFGVLVYLDEGFAGYDKFADERFADSGSDRHDRFHVKRWYRAEVNGAVQSRIKRLGHGCGQSERAIVRQLGLSLSHKALQIKQEDRGTAKDIYDLMSDAYRQLLGLQKPTGTRGSFSVPVADKRPRRSWPFGARVSNAGLDGPPPTDVKFLIKTQKITIEAMDRYFDGWDISNAGSMVAYWSNTTIFIYRDAFLAHDTSDNEIPENETSSSKPPKHGKHWKGVSLGSLRLVAFAENSKTCYIFNLRNDRVEPPDLTELVEVHLPVRRVWRVAISQNDCEVACVAEGHDQTTYLLYHPKIVNVVQAKSPGKPNHYAEDVAEEMGWKIVPLPKLRGLAQHVAQLDFGDNHKIFLVVKPEKRQYVTVMVDMSSDNESYIPKTFRTEEGNNAYDPLAPLYTCFIPYGRESDRMGAVVEHEKTLRLLDFTGRDAIVHRTFDIKNYRILKLMYGKESDKLYGLGAEGRSQTIVLLEIPLEDINPSTYPTTVKPNLLGTLEELRHGDHFVAYLSEFSPPSDDNGSTELYMLVASSPGGKKQLHRITTR